MKTENTVVKGTFWSAALFYFLIGFEFLYMAGPFAAYLYSVYAPALNYFNDSPTLSWLNSFFLPHLVEETSSTFINILGVTGIILAVGGFLAFCIGAGQVYYNKLRKKGVVTGGIYNYVRHPQYASFIICSLGMLILWPRFIVAIMFVTMLFFYYLLAKVEEKECTAKFGQSYLDYKNRTNMFFPFSLKPLSKLCLPQAGKMKVFVLVSAYFFALAAILGLAKGLQTLSINSLYTVYTNNSVDLAVCKMSEEKIKEVMRIVRTDGNAAAILSEFDNNTQFINYILPVEWFVPEIPMNDEAGGGHRSPDNYDQNKAKVIIVKASPRKKDAAATANMFTNVHTTKGITEIWVDLSGQRVSRILDMPEHVRFEGVPVAFY